MKFMNFYFIYSSSCRFVVYFLRKLFLQGGCKGLELSVSEDFKLDATDHQLFKVNPQQDNLLVNNIHIFSLTMKIFAQYLFTQKIEKAPGTDISR